LEDFEFLELEEFNQEFVRLSNWEFIDASDADSVEKHNHSDSEPPQPQEEPEDEDKIGSHELIGPLHLILRIGSHNRRRQTRHVLDLAFQTHLNYKDDEGQRVVMGMA
jgi:hypothetical protein